MKLEKPIFQILVFMISFSFIFSSEVNHLRKNKKNLHKSLKTKNIVKKAISLIQYKDDNNSSNNTNFTTIDIYGPNITKIVPKNKDGIFPDEFKFVINPNVLMTSKSKFETNSKCVSRTGALYFVNEDLVPDENDKTKKIKKKVAKAYYTVLTQNAITCQETQIPDSVAFSILLPNLDRVTQQYKGSTCFELIEKGKESSPYQLCAETKEEMDSWIVSLLEFKECLLKDRFELIDANGNAFKKKEAKKEITKKPIITKDMIKQGIGTVPVNPNVKSNKALTPTSGGNMVETVKSIAGNPENIFYTNTFTPTSEVKEVMEADETLNEILNEKKREELAQRQIKRQVEDKLRKVREAHKKILDQQKALMKKLALQKQKEMELETKKIEDDAHEQEQTILKNALEEMKKISVIFHKIFSKIII